MFDKLIESNIEAAEFKGRSRYFMVSTVVVGILFVTALVFSLYAADIGLGVDSLEVSMMVAPVMPEAPEPPKPVQPEQQHRELRSQQPTRIVDQLRTDEISDRVPPISVTKNAFLSHPPGDFKLDRIDSVGPGDPNGVGNTNTLNVGSSSAVAAEYPSEVVKLPDPPPATKAKVPPPTMISKGVINGQAKYLPPPPYPVPAKMIRAEGPVSVQITIDETGKVISSRSISGHPLLRAAAEKAAWSARFSPTYLSNVAVKVTGVIVYNFKAN